MSTPNPAGNFGTLVQRLRQLPFDELRKQSDGYLEFVLSVRHLTRLYPLLEDYFGTPFKPAGVAPTREAESCAKSYGGIQKQQTLYFFKRDGFGNCAMIWPWNDAVRVTVKVAQGQL